MGPLLAQPQNSDPTAAQLQASQLALMPSAQVNAQRLAAYEALQPAQRAEVADTVYASHEGKDRDRTWGVIIGGAGLAIGVILGRTLLR